MEDADGDFGLTWPGLVADQTAWLFRPMVVHTFVYTGVVRPEVAPYAVLSSTAIITATSLDVNPADNAATAWVIVDKPEVALEPDGRAAGRGRRSARSPTPSR